MAMKNFLLWKKIEVPIAELDENDSDEQILKAALHLLEMVKKSNSTEGSSLYSESKECQHFFLLLLLSL